MFLKKILHYLNPLTIFNTESERPNINTRFMHGINRISILMFLVGLIIVLIKIFKS